jgi:hypothetical protein
MSATAFRESTLFSSVDEGPSKSWSELQFAGRQHGSSNIRGQADMFGCSRDWERWPKRVLRGWKSDV